MIKMNYLINKDELFSELFDSYSSATVKQWSIITQKNFLAKYKEKKTQISFFTVFSF